MGTKERFLHRFFRQFTPPEPADGGLMQSRLIPRNQQREGIFIASQNSGDQNSIRR